MKLCKVAEKALKKALTEPIFEEKNAKISQSSSDTWDFFLKKIPKIFVIHETIAFSNLF